MMTTTSPSSMTAARRLHVLIVEDDDTHAALISRCIHQLNPEHRMERVVDGIEAMMYLRREQQYFDARRPHLVLLDLRLPRMDGHEVLAAIRADKDLRMLPVVVLTTSDWPGDVDRAFDAFASGYVVKQMDFQAFCAQLHEVVRYWSLISRTPGDPAPPRAS